jgi:predicted kinase
MMRLEAPERDVPADPAVLRLPPAALLVVAGVPGAGKTTLLSRLDAPGSLVLDPEPIRERLAGLLGPLPYRLWRPLVHAGHFLRVLLALPGRSGLVVHDTGTRPWRRRLLAALARRLGRTAHLLLLDVTAEAALEGQRHRRRAMSRSAFAGHWRRWRSLREELGDAGDPEGGPSGPRAEPLGPGQPSPLGGEGWASVRLLDRAAADRLARVVIPRR